MKKIAIYPGSFDPMTIGHLDILKRSLSLFDEVIVLIAVNNRKKSRFSVEKRLEMIKEITKNMPNVKVDFTDGLTIDYARKVNARHLIRGLRAVTDFEYEFQLAAANEFCDSNIDMIFFMGHNDTSFINSSTVMELFENGVDVSKLVPAPVLKYLKELK